MYLCTKFIPFFMLKIDLKERNTRVGLWLIALVVVLLIADQALKIWVKTNMTLGAEIPVISDWFRLLFVENNGAAFGMQIDSASAFDWGKLLLSLFRIVLVGGLCYYVYRLIRKEAPIGVLVGLSLIIAGALGNIIDSALYGVMFSQSTPLAVAEFGGSYAPFMMGEVVDMFSFKLFQWADHPQWLSFLFDSDGYFFGPVFNLADAYISVAIVYMLIFQYKFFK